MHSIKLLYLIFNILTKETIIKKERTTFARNKAVLGFHFVEAFARKGRSKKIAFFWSCTLPSYKKPNQLILFFLLVTFVFLYCKNFFLD